MIFKLYYFQKCFPELPESFREIIFVLDVVSVSLRKWTQDLRWNYLSIQNHVSEFRKLNTWLADGKNWSKVCTKYNTSYNSNLQNIFNLFRFDFYFRLYLLGYHRKWREHTIHARICNRKLYKIRGIKGPDFN